MGERQPTRRRVLRAVLAAGVLGTAGCVGDNSTDEERPESGSTAARSTATASSTPSTVSPGTESTTTRPATGDPAASNRSTNSMTGEGDTTTAGAAAGRAAHTVGMYTDLYFDPIGLFVEPGETVAFELVSGTHSATAYHPENMYALNRRVPRGAPAWDTEQFSKTGTFRSITFETEGTHDYYCIPHKQQGMVGRIVVGDPDGPATESPNPDGDLPDSERIAEQRVVPYEAFETASSR